MFWVMIAGILPDRTISARTRWPTVGLARSNCSFMTKRRRQSSSRAEADAQKCWNVIGSICDQSPPGLRKSGMPAAVEIPAPVNATGADASRSSLRKLSNSAGSGAPPSCRICVCDRMSFSQQGELQ